MRDFKAHSVRYQRNGICGIGFYAVSFSFNPGDGKRRPMVGFVFPAAKDGAKPDHYGVIDPANQTECWRGDHFVDDMNAAIAAATADGSAFR